MTNLLEYIPNVTPEKLNDNFDKFLYEDVWMSYTPDLPVLRYAETIPVFIWDELKTYAGYVHSAGIDHKQMTTENYLVETKEKYLPFKNTAKKKASDHDMLLPADLEWTKGFKVSPFSATPRKVSGRIIHVSLEAIQLLDAYYFNTQVHTRRKEQFISSTNLSLPEVSAWMYTMPTANFTKYLPHEETYELMRGFEPQQCSSMSNGPYTSNHSKP